MKPSDKVICINDDWSTCHDVAANFFSSLPVKGRVYVVEAVITAKNGEAGLVLVGITGLCPQCCFYPWRFALLSEAKQRNHEFVSLDLGARCPRNNNDA